MIRCEQCDRTLSDQATDTTARTIVGEARGQGLLDKIAVACVIRERALRPGWWGRSVAEVCRHPWQFTAWQDHNRAVIERAEQTTVWAECLAVADLVLHYFSDRDVLNLFGVSSVDDLPTHYHDHSLPKAPASWGTQVDEVVVPWPSAFRWYVVRQGRPARKGARS